VDRRPPRPLLHNGGAALGSAGLIVLLVGTFLPWLRSGRSERNSYRAGGALRRLLDLHGALDTAVSAWPFIGVLCACVVAIFAVGLRRCAAVLALLTAVSAAAVAVTALRVDGNSLARPLRLGPAVTILGATVVAIAATLVLTSSRRRRTSSRSK
jgi:hypothetical protein